MDCQLGATGPAEYRFLVPFPRRPNLDLMIGKRGMTIFAGIVSATALHLDRDNVGRPPIVLAPSLGVDIDATNFWKNRNHCAGKQGPSTDC